MASTALAGWQPPVPSMEDRKVLDNTYIFHLDDEGLFPGLGRSLAYQAVSEAGGVLRHFYEAEGLGFSATIPVSSLSTMLEKNPRIVGFEKVSLVVPTGPGGTKGKPDKTDDGSGGKGGGGGGDDTSCKGGPKKCPPPEDDTGGSDPGTTDPGGSYPGGSAPSNDAAGCDLSNAAEMDASWWGVDRLDPEYVWKAGGLGSDEQGNGGVGGLTANCGENVQLFIIDFGFDTAHPELNPFKSGRTCTSSDCVDGISLADEHGTFVAGIAAARKNGSQIAGVAPAVDLHFYQIAEDNPVYGPTAYSDSLIKALDDILVRNGSDFDLDGASVINLSLMVSTVGGGDCSSIGSDMLKEKVCALRDAGAVIVSSFADTGGPTYYPPASYDAVIGVASTSIDDDLSAFTAASTDTSTPDPMISVTAPGEEPTSTVPGGGLQSLGYFNSGSSYAAPLVSGVVALCLSEKSDSFSTGGADVSAQVISDLGNSLIPAEVTKPSIYVGKANGIPHAPTLVSLCQ